jgi:glutamyl-tRNA synthetase
VNLRFNSTMMNKVRVRYAPSPTGHPHVGNIRTALFNWLYAKHMGGTFILRIEDTDQSRIVKSSIETIYKSLEWLGLNWDEGPLVGGPYEPYLQSERQMLGIYHEAAERLLQEDHSYYCYCTIDELTNMRKEQQLRGETPRYNRRCRSLSPTELQRMEGLPHVIRFKTPLANDLITVTDAIRGMVTFETSTLDDFVLLKSDQYPTYHLASVVDDHAMQISDVLRAEEWLSSTPRHLLLYEALGYNPPSFAHLPMILGADRTKLAKRHGATSLMDYIGEGFLPETMFNFLALLGWSLDDKTEILTRDELIRHFSLPRVSRAPAIFDREKLTWMNGTYLRKLHRKNMAELLEESLVSYVREFKPNVVLPLNPTYIRRITPLVQERLKTLSPDETWATCCFFFLKLPEYDTHPIPNGMSNDTARTALQSTLNAIELISPFNAQTIEQVVRPLAETLNLKTRELFGTVRIAITGSKAAPPLFDTMAVLGKKRVLARLRHLIKQL